MLGRNSQTGTMVGTIYKRGWKKTDKKVISIKGLEIRLCSNSFETKDGNAQLGDARMILWIDQFVLKCSRGVFKICVQTSQAELVCPFHGPMPVLRAATSTPAQSHCSGYLTQSLHLLFLLQIQPNLGTLIQR